MCGAEDSGDTGHRVSFCIHTCVSTKGSNCLEGLNREGTSSSSAEASTVSLDVRACVRACTGYVHVCSCVPVCACSCVCIRADTVMFAHTLYLCARACVGVRAYTWLFSPGLGTRMSTVVALREGLVLLALCTLGAHAQCRPAPRTPTPQRGAHGTRLGQPCGCAGTEPGTASGGGSTGPRRLCGDPMEEQPCPDVS